MEDHRAGHRPGGLPRPGIVYRKFLEKVFTVLKGHGFSRAEKIALIKGL